MGAGDILMGVLEPGERVVSMQTVREDAVAVRLVNGTRHRTMWLHKYEDDRWGGGLEPPPGIDESTVPDNKALQTDGAARRR